MVRADQGELTKLPRIAAFSSAMWLGVVHDQQQAPYDVGGRETSGGPRHAPAANISARTLPMRVRPLCLKATDRTHYTFTTRARLRPSPPQQPYSLCTRSLTPCTRPARTLLPRRAGRSVIVAHHFPCNLLRLVVVSTGLLLAALELVSKLRGLLARLVVAME